MPAVPFPRIPLAFLPAPHAAPGRGQGLAEPPHPRPSRLCGRGRHGEAVLPIAPGEGGRQYVSGLKKASARPNEPKRLKTLVINKIARKAEKQTQASYQPWYQSVTAILAPILKKFVWIASALLRIQSCGPRAARRPSLGGFTSKARMSFKMNGMAFNTARYRGLGRSQGEDVAPSGSGPVRSG